MSLLTEMILSASQTLGPPAGQATPLHRRSNTTPRPRSTACASPPQMPGQRRDGRVVEGESIGGPPNRPRGELGPRRGSTRGLAERDQRTGCLRQISFRHVTRVIAPKHRASAAMRSRRRDRWSLQPRRPYSHRCRDRSPRSRPAGHGRHAQRQCAHPRHAEQHIRPSAPAHVRTTRTVLHVGSSSHQAARSLLIMKAPKS
jgi:hypothetical protein